MKSYTPRYLYRKLTRPEIITNNGIRMRIPETLHPPLVRQIYRGTYEQEEALLLARTVKNGDRVLDLGAGLGLSAIIAAKYSGNRVVAVEADPQHVTAIRENAALNDVDVEVVSTAVGTAGGQADFFVETMFVESSLLPTPTARRITVPVTPIGELLERFQPTYLNVDVEGAEFDILPLVRKGAVRCISVEVHDRGDPKALVQAMRRNGFILSEELSSGAQFHFA